MKQSLRVLTLIGSLLMGVFSLQTHATPIILAGDSNIFTTAQDNEVFFQNVFDGQSVANFALNSVSSLGSTASETMYGSGTTITSALLSGYDFMIFGFGRSSVSASELTAIADFYNAGGALFLYGEGNISFTYLNNAVNEILATVGSSMSLSTTSNFDLSSFSTLTGLVTTGPYTVGVNSWTTAYAAAINSGSGQAIISGTADNGFGIAVAVENLNTVPVTDVPAPATLALFALGLAGLVRSKRKA